MSHALPEICLKSSDYPSNMNAVEFLECAKRINHEHSLNEVITRKVQLVLVYKTKSKK